MREGSIRRAVQSAALLETVELRRLLSVVPDATFGSSGIAHYSDALPANTQYDQIVTADGVGSFTTVAEISGGTSGENQLIVRRFTSSGSPIGAGTTVALPFDPSDSLIITDVALDAGNNAYVAGSRVDSAQNATFGFVVRIDASGNLDPSFVIINTPKLAFDSQNVQLAVNDSAIYAAYVTADTATPLLHTANVQAFDSSGAPLVYGTAGTASIALPQDGGTANELLVDGNGLLLVGTTFNTTLDESIYVGRVDVTGNLDNGFGTNGFGVSSAIGYDSATPLVLSGVARVSSGFVVAGSSRVTPPSVTPPPVVFVKLGSNFDLDPGFAGTGVLTLTAPLALSTLDLSTRTLTADSAGNIYATGVAVGDDSADLAVIRLTPAGALDAAFDGDGIYTLDEADADIGIGITSTASGAILVTGSQVDTAELQTGVFVQFAEPVVNSAPIVASVATAGSVNTGAIANFSSSFVDADLADTFTVAWDFGDGNTLSPVAASQGAVAASHAYAVAGTYVVTVTVADSAGHVVSNTGSINVVTPNVAPVVANVTGPSSVFTGVVANFANSFSDADASDTFTVAWNFGDGNTVAPAAAVQGSVAASHAYSIAGNYTVTLTVTDSAGHVVTQAASIVVNTPPPPLPYTITSGQLALSGNAGADTVELVKSGANFILTFNGTPYTINSSLSSVVINGGSGADFIRVSSQITIPVSLVGGAGDDTLRGGSGDDVIIGDDGNDIIVGRDGQDLMIGGTGADYLVGREDADILVSGTTPLSSNLEALSAIQAEWSSNHSLLVKLANVSGLLPLPGRLNGSFFLTPNVTVFNDNSVDTLSGGDGTDLYYITLFGLNSDIIRDGQNSFPPTIQSLVFGD